MAIGLTTGSSGEYLPIIKYDARAGRLFRVDRSQDGSGAWVSNNVDITMDKPTFMVDFRTLEVGYIAFTATGPSFVLAPLGQPMPQKPTPDHKAGFRMRVFSPKFLDGLREFSSSSKAVINAIDTLHNDYEAAPEAASGKLPIVQMSSTTPITTKGPQGTTTNYAPVFSIVSWADRPADWPEPTVPAPKGGARTSAPPQQAVNHAPPPAPKVKPEAAAMEEEEAAMPF